jgi:phage recombination protein Bet
MQQVVNLFHVCSFEEKTTMNAAVAQIPQRASLVTKFANKYSIEAEKLLPILKATAFKVKDGEATNEQMAALLVVADQYGLNPFTREIFAFPDKQNGIVPVVGVDGWSRIINDHPQSDGIEFRQADKAVIPEHGQTCPEWMECVIYRKDRSHPIVVREYLDEVYRPPFQKDGRIIKGPWQSHTKRFLRHKTLIQAARLAYGFSGIYDEDEAERIVERDITPEIQPERSGAARLKSAVVKAEPITEPTSEARPIETPPQAQTEQPEITVIDAIAKLASFTDIDKMAEWTDVLPNEIRADSKFQKAFKKRMDEIKVASA